MLNKTIKMNSLEKYQQIKKENIRIMEEGIFLYQTIDGSCISSRNDVPRQDLPQFQVRYQKYVQDLIKLKEAIPPVYQVLDREEHYDEAEEMRTLLFCLTIRQKMETGKLEFIALQG